MDKSLDSFNKAVETIAHDLAENDREIDLYVLFEALATYFEALAGASLKIAKESKEAL